MKNAIYYDYTDKNIDEWAESLRNNDLYNYEFIQKDIASSVVGEKKFLKVYRDGIILTFEG